MAKVLVTGATGYIGKRLVLYLLNQGHVVFALCQIKGTTLFEKELQNLYIYYGDLAGANTLKDLETQIDVAFYLVHSMSEVVSEDLENDKQNVKTFLDACTRNHVKQIIYLGSIIEDENTLSERLQSRLVVEKSLKASMIPTTLLRSSMILGAGSAAFEILRDTVEKLSIIACPYFAKTLIQPISILDVLFYLNDAILNTKYFNQTLDIGGQEVLTFKELMKRYAAFRGLKRWIFIANFLPVRFSTYFLMFISSVKYSICLYFFETLKQNSVVKLGKTAISSQHTNLSIEETLKRAFEKIAQNEVVSTWMDSWEIKSQDPSIANYIAVPQEGCLKDVRKVFIKGPKEETVERIWQIGGETGYYAMDWAWYLRGFFDQMIGGVGLNRGRRHPHEIIVGDSIDFWRVLKADKINGHLILWATMKVPGDAWLEFNLQKVEDKWQLLQTATFRPNGIWGRLYWWSMYPFHLYIFARMAKTIAGVIKS